MKSPTNLVCIITLGICLTGCVVVPQRTISDQPPDPAVEVSVVAEDDVPPVAVEEYYFVGGRYYYWHPGVNRYVILRGRPPAGFRVRRMEHLERRDNMGRAVRENHAHETRPQVAHPPVRKDAKKAQPQKKKQPAQNPH